MQLFFNMKRLVLLSCACVIVSSAVVAQQIKLLNGDLTVLKGQKSYNIIFRYDSMIVGVDTPEKRYLNEKERLWDAKEQDKGFAFVQMWFNARTDLYEPEFKKNFSKYSGAKLDDQNAPYTLIVKTIRTEGGWNGGLINSPAEIDGILWVVDSKNKSTVVAKIVFYNFRGQAARGGDFEMPYRIRDAYTRAGGGLGDFLKRKSK